MCRDLAEYERKGPLRTKGQRKSRKPVHPLEYTYIPLELTYQLRMAFSPVLLMPSAFEPLSFPGSLPSWQVYNVALFRHRQTLSKSFSRGIYAAAFSAFCITGKHPINNINLGSPYKGNLKADVDCIGAFSVTPPKIKPTLPFSCYSGNRTSFCFC